MYTQKDSLGLMQHLQSMLSMISACKSKQSHKCKEKLASMLHRPAIKWFFKMQMVCYKMASEGADGLLGGIALADIQRWKLEVNVFCHEKGIED